MLRVSLLSTCSPLFVVMLVCFVMAAVVLHTMQFYPYWWSVFGEQFWLFHFRMFTPPRLGSGVLRSVRLSVCVSVCLSVREHISGTAIPICTKFFVQIHCNCGSVLLWRRCSVTDTLCTSCFMNDVTFDRSGPYADVCLPLATLWYQGGVWCLWMPCSDCAKMSLYQIV